jgi:hypothetical protein
MSKDKKSMKAAQEVAKGFAEAVSSIISRNSDTSLTFIAGVKEASEERFVVKATAYGPNASGPTGLVIQLGVREVSDAFVCNTSVFVDGTREAVFGNNWFIEHAIKIAGINVKKIKFNELYDLAKISADVYKKAFIKDSEQALVRATAELVSKTKTAEATVSNLNAIAAELEANGIRCKVVTASDVKIWDRENETEDEYYARLMSETYERFLTKELGEWATPADARATPSYRAQRLDRFMALPQTKLSLKTLGDLAPLQAAIRKGKVRDLADVRTFIKDRQQQKLSK